MVPPKQIFGIDFSGAQDAGNKIWIAKGIPLGKNILIEECFRAMDRPNYGRALDVCLPALVNMIQSDRNTVFGFDFPFGLPMRLVKEKTWKDFVYSFPKRYISPEAFRELCRKADGGHELKRQTDIDAHTPLSPYNLRLYKQTYYGISKILFPLVRDKSACVFPFHKPVFGKPLILEICPASTLKDLMKNRVPSYKGRKEIHRENRHQILKVLMKERRVMFHQTKMISEIIADKGGDALDSVIAAFTTFRALQKGLSPADRNEDYMIEGYVYV